MSDSTVEIYLLFLFLYVEIVDPGLATAQEYSPADLSDCVSTNSVSWCVCDAAKTLGPTTLFNGIVSCNYNSTAESISVQPLHCLTFDNSSNMIVAGKCPYAKNFLEKNVIESNVNISDLNDMLCGRSNRRGNLCGMCDNDTGLAINSYGFNCVGSNHLPCQDWIWVLYIVLQLVPIAIFFILVVTFNVRTTAEYSYAFVLFAQTVSISINLVSIERDWAVSLHASNNSSGVAVWLARVVSLVYSLWNLDISSAFPDICVGQYMRSLDVLAIQYATAAFPLLLIAAAYTLIEMHGRNYRVVVAVWKPLSCCVRFRRRIDPKSTVIDIFATFLLLSYTKFTLTSFMILAPASLYLVTGVKNGTVVLYDGTIPYFSKEHLPYALPAIFVLVFVSFPPPILLFVYQTPWFQKCLNCWWTKKQIIVCFTSAFHGCFKNGTNGTYDCRFFAGIYFLLRIIIFGIYAFVSDYYVLYFSLQTVLILTCGLFIVFRPYKCDLFNLLDPLLILLYINITSATVQNMVESVLHNGSLRTTIYLYISIFLPMLYVLVYLTVWCVKKAKGVVRNRQPPQHLPHLTRLAMVHSDDQPTSIPFSPRELLFDSTDERFHQPYIIQEEIEPVAHEEQSFEYSDVHESLEFVSEGETTPLTNTLSSLSSSGCNL